MQPGAPGPLTADAEYVAALGFDTTGFDISGTAIRLARQRFPGSTVRYVVADLLNYAQTWLRAYDLVVEIITVQALPNPPRHQAIANVSRLVGPGGTLRAICARCSSCPGHTSVSAAARVSRPAARCAR